MNIFYHVGSVLASERRTYIKQSIGMFNAYTRDGGYGTLTTSQEVILHPTRNYQE